MEKLNIDALGKHFGKRIKFEGEFYSWTNGQVFSILIDDEVVGYFDTIGKMSAVGKHIELNPYLSKKYFKLGCSSLKRYFTNEGFIKFIENKYKG